MYICGVRVWKTFDSTGQTKILWHIDSDQSKCVEIVGMLEMAKQAVGKQQLTCGMKRMANQN
jgi:hypothetical protein